jgi:transposase
VSRGSWRPAVVSSGLLTLRDWLEAHEVDQVAMEATGVYWRPVWAVLEDRFKCLLVNARHVKQVPGRKTDVMDAQWLCQLFEAGLLRASLVPPKPVRTLRNLTRYRKSQIRDRQREMNRLHKVMQDTGIKLDTVATDMMGKSGRAMLDALVSGTTDPVVLADLARGQLRKKLPALRAALEAAVWHMLSTGETYVEPGGDFFARFAGRSRREGLLAAEDSRPCRDRPTRSAPLVARPPAG